VDEFSPNQFNSVLFFQKSEFNQLMILVNGELLSGRDCHSLTPCGKHLPVVAIAVNQLIEDASIFCLKSPNLSLHLSDFCNDNLKALLVNLSYIQQAID
jgi:hypothetical protein